MLRCISSLLWWAVLWTPTGGGLEGLGVAGDLPKPANNTNNHDNITHTPTKESLLNQSLVSPKLDPRLRAFRCSQCALLFRTRRDKLDNFEPITRRSDTCGFCLMLLYPA
ncbi:hypothetical protein EDB80DRAFT_339102 [Ilyonectria destructans]|nr:hypothetical protein EDB80DRAFT_339102 [Ilyonectria destructans]